MGAVRQVVAWVLALSCLAVAQRIVPPGVNSGRIYVNDPLGFSYPWPDGYDDYVGPINMLRAPVIMLEGPNESFVYLFAQDSGGVSCHKLYSERAKDAYPVEEKLSRNAPSVDIAGKSFYRLDFSEKSNHHTSYSSSLCIDRRGFRLEWEIDARTTQDRDKLISSLNKINFRDEERDKADSEVGSRSSTPREKPIRVSSAVAQQHCLGLCGKLPPFIYPKEARDKHIEGSVILKALIDRHGNVKNLTPISGPPMLVPAAIDAVKQWKYKPYKVDGKPMAVETQVTVNFRLSN